MQESELSPYAKEYIPLKNKQKCTPSNKDVTEQSSVTFSEFSYLLKVIYYDCGIDHDGPCMECFCTEGYNYINHYVYYYDIIKLPDDFKFHLVKDYKSLPYEDYPESLKKKYELISHTDYDANLLSLNRSMCAKVDRRIHKVKIVKREDYKDKLGTTTYIKYIEKQETDISDLRDLEEC